MANGSLTFGGTSTDRVAIGATTIISTPFTLLAWIYATSLVNVATVFGSRDNVAGGLSVVQFRLSGTTGNIELRVQRVTTASSYITSSTPIGTNTWTCLAATFDSSANPVTHIYAGTLASALAETTYGTTTNGSGAVTTQDGSNPNFWGARTSGSAIGASFNGRIHTCALFGAVLSLADCQSWQKRPRVTVGANTASRFYRLGNEGTGAQQDYAGSGVSGTVTGATQSDGAPIDQGDLLWQRDPANGLLLMAA